MAVWHEQGNEMTNLWKKHGAFHLSSLHKWVMNGILNIFYYSIITKIDLQNHFVKKIFLNYNSTMFVW
jgi:hypothetical protein